MSIRRATVDDAQAVSRIAMRTFTEGFGHLYSDDDLQAFLRDNHAVDRQRVILQHPEYAIWLVERDGEIVGHAAAGPCGLPHPQATKDDGELKRLYLLAGEQNAGIGGELLQVALDWLERDGPRTLWISVWSENLAAQRFYARRGFEYAGEYEFAVGNARDREFMFRRMPASKAPPPGKSGASSRSVPGPRRPIARACSPGSLAATPSRWSGMRRGPGCWMDAGHMEGRACRESPNP